MIARQPWRGLTLGFAAALVITLGGCPTPTNRSPTANAGPDQTVAADSTVTLDGSSSSSDPRGKPLTFQWQQTGGSPTVTLSGVNTR